MLQSVLCASLGSLPWRPEGRFASDVTSLQIRVSGRVQGVGYREALRREAELAGVRGWVRNRIDGSVEALLQGPPTAVGRVLEWARRGPPAARVREIASAPPTQEFDRVYPSFERWPSA